MWRRDFGDVALRISTEPDRREIVTYTTSVLRNTPSPNPTTHLPAINIPRLTAEASIAAPIANNSEPIARERVRPKLSEIAPAKRETRVAEIKSEETTIPSKEEERGPNVDLKPGMVMTGPMVDVSSL